MSEIKRCAQTLEQTQMRCLKTAMTVAQNCLCGELLKDCCYPKCDSGDFINQPEGDILSDKKEWVPCSECRTPYVCFQLGCGGNPGK